MNNETTTSTNNDTTTAPATNAVAAPQGVYDASQMTEMIHQITSVAVRAALDANTVGSGVHPDAPLVRDHIDTYLKTHGAGTRRTYGTHLRRLRDGVGPICDQTCEPCLSARNSADSPRCRCECAKCRSSRITIPALGDERVSSQVYSSEVAEQLAAVALRIAVKSGIVDNRTRSQRGLVTKGADGNGAKETAIAAARSLFKSAIQYTGVNNAAEVDKPKRRSRERNPMRDFELLELIHTTATGGDDPDLDVLLVDYGIATGARRKGAFTLTVGQLGKSTQTIGVRDKYAVRQAVPVSLELIERIFDHAIARGGERCDPNSPEFIPDAPAFYYRESTPAAPRPLTSRRFDTLHERWQRNLEWANAEQLGYHHLRHTISSFLESNYGRQYKRRYLRHSDGNVTDGYGMCTFDQLAAAMSELLGFEHPRVHGIEHRRDDTMRRLGRAPGS